MNLLSEDDRRYILEQLHLAPDSVLANAMLAFEDIRNKCIGVRKLAGNTDFAPEYQAVHNELVAASNKLAVEAKVVVKERPNVSPGASSISKIGSETKAAILLELRTGTQPRAKFSEHMKLLWERKEVKFDGSEWYL